MKAAVVNGPGQKPQYTDFPEPVAKEGDELIVVRAAALSHFTKHRASGAHYSALCLPLRRARFAAVAILAPDQIHFAEPVRLVDARSQDAHHFGKASFPIGDVMSCHPRCDDIKCPIGKFQLGGIHHLVPQV